MERSILLTLSLYLYILAPSPMKINEIRTELLNSHEAIKDSVMRMNEDSYYRAPDGKWNAGQQLSHVLKSVKAIHRGMSIPRIQLRLMFGKSNRPSRTYDGLVQRYHERLQTQYKQPSDFSPDIIPFEDREQLLIKLLGYADRIGARLEKLGEKDVDFYVLPHPLLGKLTLREFGYFTIYHCWHHLDLIKKYSVE